MEQSVNCLLCHSSHVYLLTTIYANQLAANWHTSFQIDVTDELAGFDQIKLHECQACHLQFFPPELAGSGHLYAQLQRFEWYYMPRKWEHDVALGELAGCRRVLEIGCGRGDFVERVRAQLQSDAQGIELNGSAVRDAQRRGLPVYDTNLREVAEQFSGYYDAICSFQVLEHVPDPRGFLECCCRLLRPGGRLLLGLPNADSFLRYQFNLLDMPPHHMTRWSATVLRQLPRLLPLHLECIRLEPLQDYHIEGYIDAYFTQIARHRLFRGLCRANFKRMCTGMIRHTHLNRWLVGQSLYVSYARL